MSDLYRSGRGGAGNFHNKPSLEESKDIEAQHESALNLTRTTSATKPPQEYVHTGRGGAGNWVQPKDLASQGLTQSSSTSPFTNPGASKPSYKGGRGGAGNYEWAGSEEEATRARKEEEDIRRKEVERAVQKDVESGLARPEKAYGGAGGSV